MLKKLKFQQSEIRTKLIQIYDYYPSVVILLQKNNLLNSWIPTKNQVWKTQQLESLWPAVSAELISYESLVESSNSKFEVVKKTHFLIHDLHELVHNYNLSVLMLRNRLKNKLRMLFKADISRYSLLDYQHVSS